MKKYFIILCLFFPLSLFGQTVSLLTVNQLDNRLSVGKDTVYLVNFWATWCAPCIEELPHFEKLADTMNGKPVKVLLVSLDFKSKLETVVRPFVKKLQISNEVYLLNEKSQQDYIDRIDKNWSGAIPATLVVNTKRRIRTLVEKELTYDELLNLYKTNISDE
ncbi:TlpA family protein disulfide reductase [Flavihumibacter sp. R14]|nr:TlpA family protein disulfide reductase [Flavihumibacter soli]